MTEDRKLKDAFAEWQTLWVHGGLKWHVFNATDFELKTFRNGLKHYRIAYDSYFKNYHLISLTYDTVHDQLFNTPMQCISEAIFWKGNEKFGPTE